MRPASKTVASRAAMLLLLPALLVAGCQKQNNAQSTQQNAARGPHPRLRAVCADDIQKYCANADRPRLCLRQNIDKLSDACKAAMQRRRPLNNGGNGE